MDMFKRITPAGPVKPEVEAVVDSVLNNMEVLEAIDAIQDGVLSHDDLAPTLVNRIVTELSPEDIAEHLGAHHPLVSVAKAAQATAQVHGADPHPDLRPPLRFPGKRFMIPRLLAIAATLALVAGTAFLVLSNRTKDPSTFGWSASAIAANGPLEPLPIDRLRPSTTEPVWSASSGTATMGPAETSKRQLLQRATVILRDSDGMGSGVLISADGWILTNYHVVASAVQRASLLGEAARLDAIFAVIKDARIKPGDEHPKAKVYRVDPTHDLALLKLDSVPTSLSPISFIKVAERLPEEGDEVIAIGSPGGLAPWNMRSGSVARIYQHPTELSENVGMPARPAGLIQRVRAEVIQTDIGISPGDAGGPLLNHAGSLVGVTFAIPANLRAGNAGLHIALPHIKTFVASLPKEPELVPPDFFAAANPALAPTAPRPITVGGMVESVVWPFIAKGDGSGSASSTDVAAIVTYIDADRRTKLPESRTDAISAMMPRGLWSLEEQGQFRFTAAILRRPDGLVAVGTTNAQGIVSEVRLNRENGTITQVAYIRLQSGVWRLAPDFVGKPVNPSDAANQGAKIHEAWDRAVGGDRKPTRGSSGSANSEPDKTP